MRSVFFVKINVFAMISLLAFCSCASSRAQENSNNKTSQLIEDQKYTFVARTVFPTEDSRYNPRNLFPNAPNLYQLTSRYDLRVTPDSVVAYLPFYGRSFTAPLNPSEGGIKFTSTDFTYKKSTRKKNIEIEITPKDNRDVRSVYMTISPNGFASLRVQSLNKTPIAFNGVIEENK